MNGLSKEHSPLRQVSLYGWSLVLQDWIELLHSIQITTYLLLWSDLVLLNWIPAVPWWWSNGQRARLARLLLQRSKFESC